MVQMLACRDEPGGFETEAVAACRQVLNAVGTTAYAALALRAPKTSIRIGRLFVDEM